MKTALAWVSMLMICGALTAGCGGNSNSSNGSTCSNNGLNGTMQSGSCVVGSNGVANNTACPTPGYTYYVGSVPSLGGQSGCCSQQDPNSNCVLSPQACQAAGGEYNNGDCL